MQKTSRKSPVQRAVSVLIRAAVVAACFLFILRDLDFHKSYEILAGYGIVPVLLAPVYLAGTILPPALRLRFLMAGRLGLGSAYQAVVLGLGLNVFLPARLGEVAKAVLASDRAGAPVAKGFSMVFWERLFDLQALLAMAVVVAALYGREVFVAPLVAVIAGIWILVLVQRRWPGVGLAVVRLVPTDRARNLAREFLEGVTGVVGLRFFLVLAAYTVFIWVWYPAFYGIVLVGAAGMPLDVSQVLLVFLTAALGAAIPSSPGALGVYEASVYLGLSWCGIGKEEAVAAALALRCLMFVPLAIGGAAVLAGSRLDLGRLRLRAGAGGV